jgi:glycosyltransferase involved in cell wall biosynthesis
MTRSPTPSSPLVSVVTVCLDAAATLERALASVAAQTWPAVEHIVIDGGSTDGTLDVLARHGRHVATAVSEPDRGIYDAMNKGVARATGDVLCFLNADDAYVAPDVLAAVATAMADDRLDALYGDVDVFLAGAPHRTVRRYRSDRFRPDRLGSGWMPAHPALFMRSRIYRDLGGFRTDYRIAGDFEFVARAFRAGPLAHRHVPRVLVRMQHGGVSTAGLRNTLVLNREVLRACRENDIPTGLLRILSRYPAKLLELVPPSWRWDLSGDRRGAPCRRAG